MGTRETHPVWEVYDALRTAKLNAEYFTVLLSRAKTKSRRLDTFLQVAVPSSAVGALPLWSDSYLSAVWGVLLSISAFLSVVKPFLRLTDSVQSYEAAIARFRTVEADLAEIRTEIAQAQAYSPDARARFLLASRALYRAREIEPKEPPDTTLRNDIYDRITKEVPKESFFVPKE
jgi:hypothetical protein